MSYGTVQPVSPAAAPAHHPRFGVVGVHGGAGASTIACWLSSAGQAAVAVELPGSQVPVGCRPVLVAAYTASGTLRAAEYLGAWPTGLPRPWLVLVRDAPLPPPKVAVYRRRAVAGRVLGMSDVPYLPRLRTVDNPEDGLKAPVVARAARRLRAELGLKEG